MFFPKFHNITQPASRQKKRPDGMQPDRFLLTGTALYFHSPRDLQANHFIIPFTTTVMLSLSTPIINSPRLGRGQTVAERTTAEPVKGTRSPTRKTVTGASAKLRSEKKSSHFPFPRRDKTFKCHWRKVFQWLREELRTSRSELRSLQRVPRRRVPDVLEMYPELGGSAMANQFTPPLQPPVKSLAASRWQSLFAPSERS